MKQLPRTSVPEIIRGVVAFSSFIRTTPDTTPKQVPCYVVPRGFGKTAIWLGLVLGSYSQWHLPTCA